jgi:hypothetical protein
MKNNEDYSEMEKFAKRANFLYDVGSFFAWYYILQYVITMCVVIGLFFYVSSTSTCKVNSSEIPLPPPISSDTEMYKERYNTINNRIKIEELKIAKRNEELKISDTKAINENLNLFWSIFIPVILFCLFCMSMKWLFDSCFLKETT